MITKTLLDYYIHPSKKAKIVGVIVDATRPYKTETAPDFTTKIKIIDEALNLLTNVNSQKKYIHVFIYSKTLKEAPDITCIGNIIYLKHYDLEFVSMANEVKAKKRGSFSKYYVFDGHPEDPKDFEAKASDDPQEYVAKPALLLRIQELRKWSFNFFSKHSLLQMNWFGSFKIDTSSLQTKDFDMILRLHRVKETNTANLVVFELVDAANHTFFLQYSKEHSFNVGDLMKIRSISKMGSNGDLLPNTYSSLLKIPEFYFDSVHFKEKIIYEVTSFEKNKPIEKQDPTSKLIETYIQPTDFLATIIKTDHDLIESTRKITDLKKILLLNEEYRKGKIKGEELKSTLFRIRCYIFDIIPEELAGALKFFCQKCKKMSDYHVSEQKHCCNSLNQAIWNIKLAVKDLSIDEEAQFLELFICDFDGNGSEIFKNVGPPKLIKPLNFEENSNKYKHLVQKILDLSSIDYLSEFILEPLLFGKEVIYRIIDTKFTQTS